MTARHVVLIDASGDTVGWLSPTLRLTHVAWEAGMWTSEQIDDAVRWATQHLRSDGCRWLAIPAPMPAIDGAGRHLSPLGDQRERAVLCRDCRRRETWAMDGVCDACHRVAAGVSA